jgi:hypothetical protein
MSRLTRSLLGLVLVGIPLAASAQAPQPTRRGNSAATQVPAPRGRGPFNPAAAQVPQQPPAPPSVQISFDRNPVRVGEDSIVTLQPADVVANSAYLFTVNYDDGTPGEQFRGSLVHQYRDAGAHRVSVVVSTVPGSEVFDPMPFVTNNDAAVTVVNIELSATPTSSSAGDAVTFATQFQSSDPNIRYRFNFGNGSSSDWSTTPQTSYSYPAAGQFRASAEVGRLSGAPEGAVFSITQSGATLISVAAVAPQAQPTPPRDPSVGTTPIRVPKPAPAPWAAYGIAALAALSALTVLGYGARHWLFSSRPTLEVHQDADRARLADEPPALEIQLQVRLHRPVVDGERRVRDGKDGLIKVIRRTHG